MREKGEFYELEWKEKYILYHSKTIDEKCTFVGDVWEKKIYYPLYNCHFLCEMHLLERYV